MTDAGGQGDAADRLRRDWETIWLSETAAFAGDAEAASLARRLVAIWAAVAGTPAGEALAGTGSPSRPAPAPTAPDARDIALDRLERRVAELERRLDRPG